MWLPRRQQRSIVALTHLLTRIMTLTAFTGQLEPTTGLQYQRPDDLSRSTSAEWSDELRSGGGRGGGGVGGGGVGGDGVAGDADPIDTASMRQNGIVAGRPSAGGAEERHHHHHHQRRRRPPKSGGGGDTNNNEDTADGGGGKGAEADAAGQQDENMEDEKEKEEETNHDDSLDEQDEDISDTDGDGYSAKTTSGLAEPDNPPQENYQQFLTKILPAFDNSTPTNITTTAGKTVFLPCSVRHLADKTVSWIRRPADSQEDLTVLTVGRWTYTHDQRIRPVHLDNSESWALEIRYAQPIDSGIYECQVSTLPKISRFVTLNVVVGRARIIGGPQLFVNAGSRLNVSCVVEAPAGGTDFVFWYHNRGMLNLDARRDQLAVMFSADPSRQLTVSSLLIRDAQLSDSGNYTCAPSNAEQDSIQLVVLNNDTPAAMQDSLSSPGAWATLAHRELLLWMLALPVYLLL